VSQDNPINRRKFLQLMSLSAVSTILAACGSTTTPAEQSGAAPTAAPAAAPTAAPAAAPTAAPAAAPTAAPAAPVATTAPAAPAGAKVRIAVGGWAEQGTKDLLAKAEFTKKTGIDVEVMLRTDTKETELARMVSAVQAGDAPYDVLDFEDELATSFSQAGYMLPLNDLLPGGFWDDFPESMVENHKIWSTREGELFRVLHNWEMPFWFYRKDWFTEKGVAVPTTWDEVRKLGPVFTDESKGVWASVDGLIKGAFLNVYLAWISLQAGGSPFDVGEPYKQALEYIHDLMYKDKVLNPASLQKDYNQQNADYVADRVAFMRQWPFFHDVARSDDNKAWFTEDKVQIALPPAGPGGKNSLTYAAGWGFGIVKTSPNIDAAKELFKFLIDKETAVTAVQTSFWFLNARTSVLQAAGGKGVAAPTKLYSDAGAIGVRPFHPRFVEALTIIEDTAAGFLTNQTSLDDALAQAKDQLAKLA
jgi:ABC-type glycerol-3-phosphate transport system substrate-binding protein